MLKVAFVTDRGGKITAETKHKDTRILGSRTF